MSGDGTGHGHSRPDACSVLGDQAQASALGTAPVAQFWLALEQNGPWGARAATQSHLGPELGGALERMCQDAGGRFILIRRPGTHSDLEEGHPQRVYLAGGLADIPWLLAADVKDPARLARLSGLPLGTKVSGADEASQANVANGNGIGARIDAIRDTLPEFAPSPAPVLMVCANSKRDVCCAVRGRPLALASSAQRPGQVWECSHTGGHRFAPTGVLLPYGQTFCRLSPASAVAALDAASRGTVPVELMGATYDRGRSHLIAPAQAAESAVRQHIQEPSLLALFTTAEPLADSESTWRCRVSHRDGRRWDVLAVRGSGGDERPESCGKAAVPTWQWSVMIDCGR